MNKYIAIYEQELNKGRNTAFVNASAHVAADGTIDDLRDLHLHHMSEQLNEMDKLLNKTEVSDNERIAG